MANFLDLEGIDKRILDIIEKLTDIRVASTEYAKQPSEIMGGVISNTIDKLANSFDGLKLSIGRMVKVANNVDDNEVVGTETSNGVEL